MYFNDDIVGIENLDDICSINFAVDDFSGLFLHLSKPFLLKSQGQHK